jgi:hypothetical protein
MALLLLRENERLVAKVLDLQKRWLVAQGKDAEQLRLQIAALEKELEQNRQRIVQHASEKRERQTPPEPSAKPPSKGHGPREQKELDVEPVLWDLDDADKQCPACGDALDEW